MRGLLIFLLLSLNAAASEYQTITRTIDGETVILSPFKCGNGGFGYKFKAYYRGHINSEFCWIKDKDSVIVVSANGDIKKYPVAAFEKLQ